MCLLRVCRVLSRVCRVFVACLLRVALTNFVEVLCIVYYLQMHLVNFVSIL